MGLTKGGSYSQKPNYTPGQETLLNQTVGNAGKFTNEAASGYREFLPGGGGGDAIKAQAMKDYEQKTLPSILNAYGSGSKGSSALNQAVASSGANLNTDLASMLSQLQLHAAGGIGNLGLGSQQQGLSAQPFSYQQNAPSPILQILQLLSSGAQGAAGGWLGGRV